MAPTFVLSDLLGYASITCWLGAQFPQVVENIRRQSCEGLALPFLANWLMGDISNLIGCLLTHQLPFQTYLATYFVMVDFVLVIQYFYYRPAKPVVHYGHPSRSATVARAGRRSVERGHSRYRTLSTVAANVAAAAALAAQKEEELDGAPTSSRSLQPYPTYGSRDELQPGLASAAHGGEDVDDDALAALGESFYSEGGRSAGGSQRKRMAWSVERSGRATSVGRYARGTTPTVMHAFASPELPSREPQTSQVPEPEEDVNAARRSSRASKRGSTVLLLSVWALFGIGTLTNRGVSTRSSTTSLGKLLYAPSSVVPTLVPETPRAVTSPIVDSHGVVAESIYAGHISNDEDDRQDPPQLPPPSHEEPDLDRVIGRIFAWLCTTLYLTSRLPQIWKNFVRKSVEGLSMYLFVFAFLGNTFYVASILLSPKTLLPPPQNTEFIRESIPYLLGSAGTLMFDITIVTQSFIYRPRPKRLHSVSRMIEEEEEGLLTGDSLSAHPPISTGEAAIMNRGRVGRSHSQEG